MIEGKEPIVKAYIPHPLAQNYLFSACKFSGYRDKPEKDSNGKDIPVTVQKTNERTGDVLTVTSPRGLKADPDMGVFLSVIALAQKYIAEHLDDIPVSTVNIIHRDSKGRPLPSPPKAVTMKAAALFKISDLYDLLAQTPNQRAQISKHKDRIEESMKILAKTHISIAYAPSQIKKHNDAGCNFPKRKYNIGSISGALESSLWDYKYFRDQEHFNKWVNNRHMDFSDDDEDSGYQFKRGGRDSGLININILRDFVPDVKEYFLLADARLCNRLESPVARQIFWKLLSAQHFRISVKALAQYCELPDSSRLDMWLKRALNPALEELQDHGYSIVSNGGSGAQTEFVITRPKAKEALQQRYWKKK